MTAKQVLEMVKADTALVDILNIIEKLNLNEGCLCAGAIRNTIWNTLSGKPAVLLSDVDVIFFDPDISYEETVELESKLQSNYPQYQWELKNQVYMHVHHPGAAPYKSVLDGLEHFTETCTAIAVRKQKDTLELIAPYGVEDLMAFQVRPTPLYQENETKLERYRQRVVEKNWRRHWPKLRIYDK